MSQIGGQDINASLFGNKIGSKTYQSTTEILEIDNFDREFLKTLRPTFATLWELIFPKIVAIFSGPADDIDNDEIYAIVDQLCKGGYQREFYQKLVEFIEKMVDQATNNFSINGSSLVEDIICFWQSFRSSINALGKLCVILDRSYIKRELSSSLVNVAFTLFTKRLTGNSALINEITDYTLSTIRNMRDHFSNDSGMVEPMISMMVELAIYPRFFEPLLIQDASGYYSKVIETVRQQSISAYLQTSKEKIDFEESVICKLVPITSIVKLSQTVRMEIFGHHLATYLVKGIYSLLDQVQDEDLRLIYNLTMQISNGEELLTDFMRVYIKTRVKDSFNVLKGNAITKPETIENLLNLYNKIFKQIMKDFEDNANITQKLLAHFENSLKQDPALYSLCLGEFIDYTMRRISNNSDESEFDALVPLIRFMLSPINNRDVLLNRYRIALSARLIEKKYCSVECEIRLLELMKSVLGSESTSKIDGMFRDVSSSQEMSLSFNETHKDLAMESQFTLLSAGFWPNYHVCKMNVPPEFIQRMQLFDEFYHQTHKTSRELSWPLYLGQCLVHINYKNGIREIECGFIEALILKSFVTSKSISVDSLLQQFGIADTPYETELHIAIQSLACGNHRIIFKKPPGINVCNTDVIRLNYDFTHPSYRIKIEKFTTPEEEARDSGISKSNFELDAKIDCSIVYFMKQKKTMNKREVYESIQSMLKASIPESQFQARVDTLVNRDYVRMNADDPEIIEYC